MRTAKSLSTAKQLRSGDDCAVFSRATDTLTEAATSVFKLNYSSTAIPSWRRVMTSSIEIAGLHPGVTDISLLRSWKYGGLICPGVAPHATDMSSLRDLKKNSEYSGMLLITMTFRGSGKLSGARSRGFSCRQVIAKAIICNA